LERFDALPIAGSPTTPGDWTMTRNCSEDLVQQIKYSSEFSYQNLSLATTLTKDLYDKMAQNAGVGAVIYGIPVSANWAEYSSRASRLASSLNLSKISLYANTFLETRLDPRGLTAYLACLNRFGT
jgi:hypothetical protein